MKLVIPLVTGAKGSVTEGLMKHLETIPEKMKPMIRNDNIIIIIFPSCLYYGYNHGAPNSNNIIMDRRKLRYKNPELPTLPSKTNGSNLCLSLNRNIRISSREIIRSYNTKYSQVTFI